MSYTTSQYRLGPEFTPAPIKNIIIYTCLITLISAFLQNAFVYIFQFPGPMDWLSLSWWGMQRFLWWEPITFLFTHHTGPGGIGLFFLLALFFNMYILWIFGTDVFQRVGKPAFLRFYFGSGIIAGLIAFFLMPLTGQYGVISGATPSILALLVVWTMIHPESELFLFFLIPVKAKWLTLGIIGLIVLTSLSNLNFVNFSLYTSSALIGYLWGMVAWGLNSPFPALYRTELAITRLSERFRRRIKAFTPKTKGPQPKKKDTVVDISTGEPLDDDDKFIDAMLEKISKSGKSSLTWHERQRMQTISEKRKKKQS